MGIDIGCMNKTFGMSYSGWRDIRRKLIIITFMFLEKINSEEEFIYFIELKSFCKIMMDIIHYEKQNICKDNNVFTQLQRETNLYTDFLQMIRQTPIYLDVLIYYGVGGLYSLCNKSDCEGCYSPGNSQDICKWLDLIKHEVKVYDDELYNFIYTDKCDDSVYGVFYESWKHNENVIIC